MVVVVVVVVVLTSLLVGVGGEGDPGGEQHTTSLIYFIVSHKNLWYAESFLFQW